jgi:predicted patatin/cPLA2 family phospholipase
LTSTFLSPIVLSHGVRHKGGTVKLVLVFEAGGMRNAFTSGVLTALWTHGLRSQHVKSVYACSSATATALFFSSNQLPETTRIWQDELTSFRALNPARLLMLDYPADLDYVVDTIMNKLDLDSLEKCSTSHHFHTLNVNTGMTHYYEWQTNDAELIKASSRIPWISAPVSYRGMDCGDGGFSDPLPLSIAMSQENAKDALILVIRNLPMEHRDPYRWRLTAKMMFPYHPEARIAFLKRADSHHKTMDQLLQLIEQKRAYAIAPDGETCKRFTRNPKVITDTFNHGMRLAEVALKTDAFHEFLQKANIQ